MDGKRAARRCRPRQHLNIVKREGETVTGIFVARGASALLLVALAVGLSYITKPPSPPLGILIDNRGRYSLTHFQLVLWSIIVLSLVSGVFWGRLFEGVAEPLSFKIPSEVLGLLGISAGSAVTATAIKASKNKMHAEAVAASNAETDPPRFSQVFLLEEGEYADKVIDVTKFQNFIITLILMAAYIGLAITAIEEAGNAKGMGSLPGFSGTFLVLVGISQAAYVAGKLPNQTGMPEGLTVAMKPAAGRAALPDAFIARNAPPPVDPPPPAWQRFRLRLVPLPHSQPHELRERLGDDRVELAPGAAAHLVERLLDGDRIAERPVLHHRHERRAHSDHGRAERDLLAAEAVGVARPVVALVV
jgi:hypothetical protein